MAQSAGRLFCGQSFRISEVMQPGLRGPLSSADDEKRQ